MLVGEEDWRSIQETLYLISIPGLAASIRRGLKTPVENCDDRLTRYATGWSIQNRLNVMRKRYPHPVSRRMLFGFWKYWRRIRSRAHPDWRSYWGICRVHIRAGSKSSTDWFTRSWEENG